MPVGARTGRQTTGWQHAFVRLWTRHDVVEDDERGGQHKPDESLHDVADEARALQQDDEQDHVRPRELAKLVQILLLLRPQNGSGPARQLGSTAAGAAPCADAP